MAEGSSGETRRLGHAEITNALWPRIEAVEDAQGDLIAAAEVSRLPQQQARQAREALAARRRELAQAFKELDLIGEAIGFESGTSWATVRGNRLGDFFTYPKTTDLTGVIGKILGVEAGTVLGMPIEPPDALVLHVGVKGGLRPPRLPHHYIVKADEAVYTIGELPAASQNGHH